MALALSMIVQRWLMLLIVESGKHMYPRVAENVWSASPDSQPCWHLLTAAHTSSPKTITAETCQFHRNVWQYSPITRVLAS